MLAETVFKSQLIINTSFVMYTPKKQVDITVTKGTSPFAPSPLNQVVALKSLPALEKGTEHPLIKQKPCARDFRL